MYKKKFFIYITSLITATINYLQAQAGNDDIFSVFSKDKNYSSTNRDFTIALMFFITVFVVIIGYRFLQKKKKEISQSAKNYNDLIFKYKITLEEKNILDDICTLYNLKYKDRLIKDKNIFNKNIEQFITEKIEPSNENKKDKLYDNITAIRQKIGFNKSANKQYLNNSKEIQLKQRISLIFNRKLYSSFITDNRENGIYVEHPKHNDQLINIKCEDQIFFHIYIPTQGHYTFKSQILNVITEPEPVIICKHNLDLRPPKNRKSERHNIDINCSYAKVSANFTNMHNGDEFKTRKGKITNISQGGVTLHAPENLQTGTHLLFVFNFKNLIITDLKGKILKKAQLHSSVYEYGIKFMDVTEEHQKRLQNICFFLQKNQ